MKKKPTPTEEKRDQIMESVRYLTVKQRKKLLVFMYLMETQYNELISQRVKELNDDQCEQVQDFIATMPKERG